MTTTTKEPFRFEGRNRAGNHTSGVFNRDPADIEQYVHDRFVRRWQSLKVYALDHNLANDDDALVGVIEHSDFTGQRIWWADTPRAIEQ